MVLLLLFHHVLDYEIGRRGRSVRLGGTRSVLLVLDLMSSKTLLMVRGCVLALRVRVTGRRHCDGIGSLFTARVMHVPGFLDARDVIEVLQFSKWIYSDMFDDMGYCVSESKLWVSIIL